MSNLPLRVYSSKSLNTLEKKKNEIFFEKTLTPPSLEPVLTILTKIGLDNNTSCEIALSFFCPELIRFYVNLWINYTRVLYYFGFVVDTVKIERIRRRK